MVGRSAVAGNQAKSSGGLAEVAIDSSTPSEQSWLSSLVSGQQQQSLPQDSSAKLAAVETINRTQSAGAHYESSISTDSPKLTRPASGLLPASSSGGDSSWERLSSLATDSGEETASPKDDYAAITAQLAAVGPAAGTRAKSKRPATTDAKTRLAQRQPRRSSKDAPPAAPSTSLPDHKPATAAQLSTAQHQDPSSPKATAAPSASPQNERHAAATLPAATTAGRHDPSLEQPASTSPTESATTGPAASSSTSNIKQTATGREQDDSAADFVQAAERSDSPSTSGRQAAARSSTASRPPLAEPGRSSSPSLLEAPDAFVSVQGSRLLRKSIEVANWLKASTDAALSLEPSSKQQVAVQQQWQCTPEDVEAVLVWQDQRRSSKVFLGGLYVIICLRQLVLGVELLQPSSAIAGCLLALMLLNIARVALLSSRGRSSNPGEREQAVQTRITQWALQGFARLAPLLGAIAAMLYRRLSGHDRMGSTVWLGLVLWGVMGLGEAGFMQQSSLAIALWCCLFGLPSLYLQSRHILDALVEESLHLVLLSLKTGRRNTFALAGGTSLVILATAPFGTFARVSLALLSSWTVLFWKACLMSRRRRVQDGSHMAE